MGSVERLFNCCPQITSFSNERPDDVRLGFRYFIICIMNHYTTLNALHDDSGIQRPENPLLSIMTCQDYNKSSLGKNKFSGDFYLISFKKFVSGNFRYGRRNYENDNGSMIYIRPRQSIGFEDLVLTEKGFLIFIHEDYLLNTKLHSEISKYSFFDYEVSESLHLSIAEEKNIWELYGKIHSEYHNNQDEFSKEIIITHIDSILKYSQRFYKRQFINRAEYEGNLITRFNLFLREYQESGKLISEGLPTVAYMASRLSMSTRYLTDQLKVETGKTALDHIHIFLIDEAKNLLLATDNSISETAYQLGFENPPYFSRLFKKKIGITPVQFKEGKFGLN